MSCRPGTYHASPQLERGSSHGQTNISHRSAVGTTAGKVEQPWPDLSAEHPTAPASSRSQEGGYQWSGPTDWDDASSGPVPGMLIKLRFSPDACPRKAPLPPTPQPEPLVFFSLPLAWNTKLHCRKEVIIYILGECIFKWDS